MNFTTQALLYIFGETTYERANAYFNEGRLQRLTLLEQTDDYIEFQSFVDGERVYQQSVSLEIVDGELSVAGHCSCPVRYRCKHILTACLALLEQLNAQQDDTNKKISFQQQQWLEAMKMAETKQNRAQNANADHFICYFLQEQHFAFDRHKALHFTLQVRTNRRKKTGQGVTRGRIHTASDILRASETTDNDLTVDDIDVRIAERLMALETTAHDKDFYVLSRHAGADALEMAIETGRCYWHDSLESALSSDKERELTPKWDKRGAKFFLNLNIGPATKIIPTLPRFYFDPEHLTVGPLQGANYSDAQLNLLQTAPPVNGNQALAFSNALAAHRQDDTIPTPITGKTEALDCEPVPCLSIDNISRNPEHPHYIAQLYFLYDGFEIESACEQPYVVRQQQDRYVRIERKHAKEKQAVALLKEFGLTVFEKHSRDSKNLHFIATQSDDSYSEHHFWPDFIYDDVPELQAHGWQIELSKNVNIDMVEADWYASVDDDLALGNNNAWFDLRFDLRVGEESIPLAPLIAPLLQQDEDKLPDVLTLPIGSGRYARLPKQRITPYLSTLKALFELETHEEDQFKVNRFDALLIDDLNEKLAGAQKLRVLAGKLKNFDGIQHTAPSEKLQATLRPYQQQGLNWLNFLRDYQFNGVLADDMGLGKTLQTLAQLQRSYSLGETQPSLILAPTSLIGNWRKEAERFIPDVSVLVLHGDKRHQHFKDVENHQIVITTYPLVTRDIQRLQEFHFHYVVLDEAQAIKNPTTALAKAVRQLRSDHRLCLTGTPMENHLGELWSIFDFLMPGFLSSYKRFRRSYQIPIEKDQDHDRQQLLTKRLQPFMLRRSKTEVATELPPKTEIIQSVSFNEQQARLYESVRVSMDKQVRNAIAAQGFGRSQIQILDALLRLRQVCCDPALLPIEQAKNIRESAKLDYLMEMLPEQLEAGRKILLFSQFTSMLSIIEQRLNESNINYSVLTGQTKNREEAIDRFKDGDVDLFLISLKAGGVGLNLTEADTVILYDPWWNPAVENQAIDRAHRIGQEKPVFVYKLIVENSLEEKMLTMQSKKRSLADAVYGDGNVEKLLSEGDLSDLFAPLYS